MPIHKLSEVRRMPRLGKIHLGVKEKHPKTGNEYPKEVSWFVVPDKVKEVYGEKPTELKIMFPVEDSEVFFSQYYKSYGFNLLKCKGDGLKGWTWNEEQGGLKEVECPCDKLKSGECRQVGILQFLLPDVKGSGVWQISTSSRNSIIDVNSGIAFIRAVCGRIRMIPLILKRTPIEIQRIEGGKPKKGTHYTLQLDLADISLRQLQQYAQRKPEDMLLPPPDESKDDLYYPENGYVPQQEEEVEGVKVEKQAEVADDVIPESEKHEFDQMRQIIQLKATLVDKHGYDPGKVDEEVEKRFGIVDIDSISKAEADQIIGLFKKTIELKEKKSQKQAELQMRK